MAQTYLGFDLDQYPGADALVAARAQGFSWVGAYLVAPSHKDGGWPGYETLKATGLAILPIWVGAQTQGPGSHAVGAAQGQTEGLACVQEMASKGYPLGYGVAYDTENGPPITEAQSAHLTAWCAMVAHGGYKPMAYGSYENFAALAAIFGAPNVWEFELLPYVPDSAEFDGLGVQYQQNVELKLAGKLYRVDRSVSAMSDPAGVGAQISAQAQAAPPPLLGGDQSQAISAGPIFAPAPLPLPAPPTVTAKAVQAAPPISAALTAAAVAAAGAVHVTGYTVDLSGLVDALAPYLIVGVVLPVAVWLAGRALQSLHITKQSAAANFVLSAVENGVQAEAAQAVTYVDGHATVNLTNQSAANVLKYVTAAVPQRLAASGITPQQLSNLVTNRLAQVATPAHGAVS